jgi:2'-5' RNA ligase
MTEQVKVPHGGNAPYKIVKKADKWTVQNNIGEVKATYDGDDAGYQKALAYQRALYVSVPGAAKRADKVTFTGSARRRGPAPKKEKAMSLRDRLTAAYGSVDGAAKHTFIPGSAGDCMSCGRPMLSPAHDGDDPYLAESENPAGSPAPNLAEPAAYAGKGCMVALYPSDDALAGLKTAGDLPLEAKEDMHVTLAYMPETPEGDELEKLKSVVADMGRTQGQLAGVWGGTARFNPSEGSDGKPVLVALPDIPDLASFRQNLVDALDAAGFEVSMSHGYTPHLTVAYDDSGQVRAEGSLSFNQISLAAAGGRYDYPLSGEIDTEVASAPAVLELTGLLEQARELAKRKKGSHRFVGANHVHPSVLHTAGYFGGCYACGQTKEADDHDGDVGDTPAAGAGGGGAPGATSASAEGAQVGEQAHDTNDQYLKNLQDQLCTGIDAAVDQVMTLLRSTPNLPPYAAQAAALLQLVDEAIDFMLLIRGLPDADDDDADTEDKAMQDALASEAAAEGLNAADQKFLDNMVPHHRMALVMAKSELAQGQDHHVMALAGAILKGQTAEIATMKMLGAKPAAGMAHEMAELGPVEKRELELEKIHITHAKTKPDAAVPHEFRPAKYPGGSGEKQCLVCGQKATPSNVCNDPLHVTPKGSPANDPTAVTNKVGVTQPQLKQLAYAVDRIKAEDIPETSLPAVRAFLTEAYGRTLLTAPASIFQPTWEKALTPNEHMLWMQGKFVGAEKANRNGAFWNTADLQLGEPTVKHGPLNWLHEATHVVGTIADAKLILPTTEQAAEGGEPHISAVAAVWRWIYPDEAFVIEQASDQGKLWYSMECVSREVACIGDGGCGQSFPYMTMIKTPFDVCQHIREKSSTRHFVDPTFLGGAVIVPPVRPGWGEANANVLREAAALAEKAYDDAGHPDMPAAQWELLMANVLAYAGR